MHPHVMLLLRLLLGAMWLAAGLAKMRNLRQSARATTAFQILPEGVLFALGLCLPFIELALGIAFISGVAVTVSAVVSLALLAAFSGAIALNLLQGRVIECNCFGQIGRAKISWWSIARNALLGLAAAVVFLWPSDYAAFSGLLRGTAFRPSDPPLLEFVPVLLLALGAAAVTHLGAATIELARVVARAEDGPALGLPERAVLRRWARYETDSSTVSSNGK